MASTIASSNLPEQTPLAPPAAAAANRWQAAFNKAQNTVINDLGVEVYDRLIAKRVVDTYGASSGYDRAMRERAAALLNNPTLDHHGPAVFLGDVEKLLARPNVRAYLHDLQAALAAATPEHPARLWDITLAHAGNEREAARWIAALLQDYTPEILAGQGFIGMVANGPDKALLLATLKSVASSLERRALLPLPPGVAASDDTFYHYYVPREIAQRLVDQGIPRNLAFLTAGTFNLEYELLAPSLIDQRHDAVLEDVTAVFCASTGLTRAQLDVQVAALRRSGAVTSEFIFADLDFASDLHLSQEQVERFIKALGDRFGVSQQLRDAVTPLPEKTLHRMAQMVTLSQFTEFLKHKSASGLYDIIAKPGYQVYRDGVDRPILLTSQNIAKAYLGFAGAAAVLPSQRPPFNETMLTAGLMQLGPKPFMSTLYTRLGPTAGDQLARGLLSTKRDPKHAAYALADLSQKHPGDVGPALEQLFARAPNRRELATRLLAEVSALQITSPELETQLRRVALVGLDPPSPQDTTTTKLTALLGRNREQVRIGVVDEEFNDLDAAQRGAANHPRDGIDLIDNDNDPYVQYEGRVDAAAAHLGMRPVRDWLVQHGTPVMDLTTRGSEALVPIPIRSKIEGIVAALDHAAEHGACVVNISQELVAASPEDLELVRTALRAHPDLLVIMAAGNHGELLGTQANDLASIDEPNFVKVAAATSDGRLSKSSSFHPTRVQFIARGGSHDSSLYADRSLSAFENSIETSFERDAEATSHASPSVANIAAKVRLIAPQLTATEVVAVLARSAETNHDLAADARYGVIDPELAQALAATMSLRRSGIDTTLATQRVADALGLRPLSRQRLGRAAAALS